MNRARRMLKRTLTEASIVISAAALLGMWIVGPADGASNTQAKWSGKTSQKRAISFTVASTPAGSSATTPTSIQNLKIHVHVKCDSPAGKSKPRNVVVSGVGDFNLQPDGTFKEGALLDNREGGLSISGRLKIRHGSGQFKYAYTPNRYSGIDCKTGKVTFKVHR